MRGFVLISSCRVRWERGCLRGAPSRGGDGCRSGGFNGGLSAGKAGREARNKRKKEKWICKTGDGNVSGVPHFKAGVREIWPRTQTGEQSSAY